MISGEDLLAAFAPILSKLRSTTWTEFWSFVFAAMAKNRLSGIVA